MIPSINTLKLNESNPRTITTEQFEKLKNSLTSFTKMLEVRPIAYDEEGTIWGGNMRFRALTELVQQGLLQDNPKYYIELTGFTLEDKQQFAIRDNVEFGEWDHDLLANEWSDLPLQEWGVIPDWDNTPTNVNDMWSENGMPDYGDPSKKKPFRSIIVHFDNQNHVNEFSELIKQTISEKTKFLWFHKKD